MMTVIRSKNIPVVLIVDEPQPHYAKRTAANTFNIIQRELHPDLEVRVREQ